MALPRGTRVCVVDDDPGFRRTLEGFLSAAGLEVESFRSPGDFLAAAPASASAACLVLDLELPGMTGLELQEALAATAPDLPIVFISGTADVRSGVQAMRSGAVDFLEKPFDGSQLLAAIDRAVAKGGRERAERAAREEARALLARLTPRERQVCDLVAQGLLNKQIAALVGTSEHTVKVHRAHALEKLKADSVPDLVRILDRAR
ncbi:MAG TPA: response regulator [Anaeromyxobacteraceae bacterium]|nr:response regulator [Anaeromyxobacteraceae bacterium]